MFDGNGTEYFVGGDKYIGKYKEGNRHGHGTYYWADGRKKSHEYQDVVKNIECYLLYTYDKQFKIFN